MLSFQSCVSVQQIATSNEYQWVKDSSNRFYYYIEKNLWSTDFADSLKKRSEQSFEKIILKFQEDNFFPFDRMTIFIVEYITKCQDVFGKSFYNIDFRYFYQDSTNGKKRIIVNSNSIGTISYSGRYPFLITTPARLGVRQNHDFVLALLMYQTLKKVDFYLWKSEFEYAIAIYAQDNWFGYDLHDLAAHYYRNQLTFPYVRWSNAISGQLGLRNSPLLTGKKYEDVGWVDQQVILYPMTASFYKYIGEKYGAAALQKWRFIDLDDDIHWYSDKIVLEWEEIIRERQKNRVKIDSISYLRLFQPKF